MASLLCICDQGYRASVEEQDDTVVWLAHMLQRSATRTSLLLRGSAVNYACNTQQAVGVQFGDWTQRHPADFPRDLARYQSDGGKVFAVLEDLTAHGLGNEHLVEGVAVVARDRIAGLVAEHDHVSFW